MNEQTIFLAALDIEDLSERASYVHQTCADNAALRRQVEELLAAHERPGDFLDVPALEQISVGTAGDRRSSPAETSAQMEALAPSEASPAEAGEIALTFLQPSTQTGSLGRLGHYEIQEVIGRGGCGIVLKAFDESLRRLVAIKVMSPELAATSPARKRFLREARSAAAVRHENVVGIHAVEESPIPFLVMEYIAGQTLQQRLDQHGPLELQEIVQIGAQIASGLEAAHSIGLIHRDIKPSNILLESGRDRLKITDFGLARATDDASITQSGFIAGTPLYMSPEQAYGATIDPRSDLFSLGSVLYVMCSGRPPFRAATTLAVLKRVAEDQPRPIQEIIPEVPAWLSAIIDKLLAKKPADRFASAREVAGLLARRLLELQHRGVESLGSVAPPSPAAPAASASPMNPFEATPRSRLASGNRWVTAAVVLVALIGGLSLTEAAGLTDVRGTVIRLFSPDGTLVVEVDDPGVSVRVDGEEIIITGTGAKAIRLKPGAYKVIASKDGKLVRQELVTVTRNGRQVLRITKEVEPALAVDAVRKSAEYALSLGGQVIIYQDGQERPIKALAELPAGTFEVVAVDLAENARVTDAGLAAFKNSKSLKRLYLNYTQVSDAGLAHFKDSKDLTHLFLHRTNLTDAGLAQFNEFKHLTDVHLDGTRATDAGLENFKDSKNLTILGLDGTPVSDAGLAHLRDCVNLTNLGLNNTPVGDAGLAHLGNCQKLTHLHLNDTQVGDTGLEHLKALKAVMHIDLKSTKVTAEGIKGLAAALPKCKLVWDGGTVEPFSVSTR